MVKGTIQRFIISILTIPASSLLLLGLTVLLILLLCSSVYLVFRLDSIQQRVESAIPAAAGGAGGKDGLEQLATWQNMLHQTSSRKIQDYLDSNLEQISKVEW